MHHGFSSDTFDEQDFPLEPVTQCQKCFAGLPIFRFGSIHGITPNVGRLQAVPELPVPVTTGNQVFTIHFDAC